MACLAIAIGFTLESSDAASELAGLIVRTPAVFAPLVMTGILLAVKRLRQRVALLLARPRRSLEQLRERMASLPVRLRLRAVMKTAIVYFSSAVWIGCAVAKSSPPEIPYLAPLVFPLLFLAVDSTEKLSERALIALSVVAFLALASFPFAPLAFGVGGLLLTAFSLVVVLVTLARALRWRGMLFGQSPYSAAPPLLAVTLTILALVASVPDTALFPRDRQQWPIVAGEKLANSLYDLGLTFPQLLASLQAQSPGTIEPVIATLDPNLFGQWERAADPGRSLLALMVEAAVVPRTEGLVLTFPIDRSRSAIVVGAPSYLDRTHLRTCYSVACGEGFSAENCTERQPEKPLRHWTPYFALDKAESEAPGKMFSYQPTGNKYCVLFSVPLHTSGSRVPHIVRVADLWPLRTRIVGVTGVDFEGELPGSEVRLVDDRESTGSLEVEITRDGLGPDSDWLQNPPLIEVTASNEHLLEPFRGKRIALR
jgi:hypothetical protein